MKLLDFMGSSSTHSKSWHDMLALFDNKRAIEDIIVQFMQFPITNYDPTQEDTALKSEEDA